MTHSALWLPVGSRKQGIVEASKNESRRWMAQWTIPLTLALTNLKLSIFWIVRTLSCSKYCGSKFYIILVSPVGPHWGLYHCKLLSVCWHVLNMSEFMADMINLIFMFNEKVIKMMSHVVKSSDLHLSSCWKSLPRSFCTRLVGLGTRTYERKYSTCAMYS